MECTLNRDIFSDNVESALVPYLRTTENNYFLLVNVNNNIFIKQNKTIYYLNLKIDWKSELKNIQKIQKTIEILSYV